MQLAHIIAMAGLIGISSHRGSWDASRAVVGNGSLLRQAIISLKPGGDATFCMASIGSGDDMDSFLASSACWHSSAL